MSDRAPVLVLFDLVSTLTDAGPRYAQAFHDVCKKFGHTPPPPDDLLQTLGNKNLSEITDHFVGPMNDDIKKDFMRACNASCDALLYHSDWHEQLYPNVSSAVQTLNQRGVITGIFTGTREDALNAQLDYHRLRPLFDARYIRGKDNDRDGMKKSDVLKQEQLRDIIGAFGRDHGPGLVVIVGDSAADALAARNLNLSFIGFAATDAKKDHLQKAGVQHLFSDFKDLPAALDQLLNAPANNPIQKISFKNK